MNRKLYVISGSRHTEYAEKLLKDNNISFEKVIITELYKLPEISKALGFRQLPALIDGGKVYEGLGGVREYIRHETN